MMITTYQRVNRLKPLSHLIQSSLLASNHHVVRRWTASQFSTGTTLLSQPSGPLAFQQAQFSKCSPDCRNYEKLSLTNYRLKSTTTSARPDVSEPWTSDDIPSRAPSVSPLASGTEVVIPRENEEEEEEEEENNETLAARLLSREQPIKMNFLLGGPGSGKGSLSSQLNFHHISVGALLREACTAGSAQSRSISAVMSRGGILSSTLSTQVLLRYLNTLHDMNEVLVDGFPRTYGNAALFDSLMGQSVKMVLALEVSDDTMRKRLKQRRRRDDIEDIVEKRLIQFRTEWESIKEFYRRRGLLVVIDGEGSPTQVLNRYHDAVKIFETQHLVQSNLNNR